MEVCTETGGEAQNREDPPSRGRQESSQKETFDLGLDTSVRMCQAEMGGCQF